jgi:cytochrome c biogenesis protein ResB
MEIKTQAKFYKKKNINSLYFSIWFLVFTILLTLW